MHPIAAALCELMYQPVSSEKDIADQTSSAEIDGLFQLDLPVQDQSGQTLLRQIAFFRAKLGGDQPYRAHKRSGYTPS